MKQNDMTQGWCFYLCSLGSSSITSVSLSLIQLHEFQQHQQYWQVDLNCHQNQCHHHQPLHQRHMDHLWQQNNMLTFSIFNIFNCLCQSIKQISFHLLFSFYNFIYCSKTYELCSDAPFSVSKT